MLGYLPKLSLDSRSEKQTTLNSANVLDFQRNEPMCKIITIRGGSARRFESESERIEREKTEALDAERKAFAKSVINHHESSTRSASISSMHARRESTLLET